MTMDDADDILAEFPKTPAIDRRMEAVKDMGEMRAFVHWLKLSPEQLAEPVDKNDTWKWGVNLHEIETERALLLAYHQRKNMNHIPDDAELYRALTRKRRKLRWIHRKFPRYYQWWWSYPLHMRVVLVVSLCAVSFGAYFSDSIGLLLICLACILVTVGAITFSVLKFKKEDLCKYD